MRKKRWRSQGKTRVNMRTEEVQGSIIRKGERQTSKGKLNSKKGKGKGISACLSSMLCPLLFSLCPFFLFCTYLQASPMPFFSCSFSLLFSASLPFSLHSLPLPSSTLLLSVSPLARLFMSASLKGYGGKGRAREKRERRPRSRGRQSAERDRTLD